MVLELVKARLHSPFIIIFLLRDLVIVECEDLSLSVIVFQSQHSQQTFAVVMYEYPQPYSLLLAVSLADFPKSLFLFLQLTGDLNKLVALQRLLEPYGICEVCLLIPILVTEFHQICTLVLFHKYRKDWV